jgi:hypothetical protein
MRGVQPNRLHLNHPDTADPGVVFELSRRAGRPFCYMAAYQLFAGAAGLRRFILPRLGVFPVDREGADRAAFQAATDILIQGRHPLVVFPEGEVYHLADRLTPLREGAAVLALAAAKKRAAVGKAVRVVPAGIKYRFLEGHDPLPALAALMGDLESRFTWGDQSGRPLVDRLYRYAEGLLALKEIEYLDGPQTGSVRDRILRLRSFILDGLEDRRTGRRRPDPVPVRVKELRRVCLKALSEPDATPAVKRSVRADLDDLFVVVQLFSYPGDYVRECPTVEQLSEILTKFEQDTLGVRYAAPRGPRRAVVRLGEPIDVGRFLGSGGRARDAASALTAEMEARIQGFLDVIGPGRPLPEEALGGPVPQPTT